MRILAFILSLLIFVPVQAEPTRTYTGNKANTNLSGEVNQPDIAVLNLVQMVQKFLYQIMMPQMLMMVCINIHSQHHGT